MNESRALAAMARQYGVIPCRLAHVWESIEAFCLGVENWGHKLDTWHKTDYKERRLQYFWDQLTKKLCYLALANSWGEVNGRPLPPPPPGAEGWQPTFPAALSPYLSGQAKAAGAPPATAADYIQQAKQEEPLTTVEPGIVADVNIANDIYTILEGDDVVTPTLDDDDLAKGEEDSDVSIEDLPVIKEAEVGASPLPATPSSSSEMGDPVEPLVGRLVY